jgi:hypothetical protein
MTPRNRWHNGHLGAVWALSVCSVAILSGVVTTAPRPEFGRNPGVERRDADHRYRIAGKVRLLFFWRTADDVGGARITWRTGDESQSVALLIGSEPRRAPRRLNEWGYVREDVGDESTTVFGIRTVTDGNSPEEAEARRAGPGGLAELGVLCSRISRIDARSRTTTVYVARTATYRDVPHVLDRIERNARWKTRQTERPADAAPGFLTALDLMMRSSAGAARGAELARVGRRFGYVYKDAVYDLIPHRVERLPQLHTRSGLFRNLLRSEIAVRNRATGATSTFSITYGTDGALSGIPIAATYQPNWWFRVELELDDAQDVPADPAGDTSVSGRIAALCPPLKE